MKHNRLIPSLQWICVVLALGHILLFSACNDDDGDPAAPEISLGSGSGSVTVEAGVEMSVSLNLTAAAGLKTLAATNSLSSDGNLTEDFTADVTTTTFEYTFTPAVTTTEGTTFTVSFVLTDQLDRPTEALTVDVTVSASDAGPPAIALTGLETAEGERSGTADFDLTLTAEAGPKSLYLEVNGNEEDPVDLAGVSAGNYTFQFNIPDTAIATDVYQLRVALTDLLDRTSSDTLDLIAGVTNTPGFIITDVQVGGTAVKRIRGNFDDDFTLDDGPYLLYDEVEVKVGATLSITAGQTFYGQPDPDTTGVAGVLQVETGGFIKANGTSNNPIVFTSLKVLMGETPVPGDWGGIEINGNGVDEDPEIEFTYVQISYAGAFIQFTGSGMDEFRGYESLDLKDLGSEAEIHHIQIYAGADEGIRMDGGTVNVKYLVAGNCLDSDINWDGWAGFGQFWLIIGQNVDKGELSRGDRGMDGNDGLDPKVTNISIIGPGEASGLKAQAARVDDDPVFEIYNAIFAEWPDDGVEIEQEGANFTADLMTSDGIIAHSYLWSNDGGAANNWKDDGDFFDPSNNAVFNNVIDTPIPGISTTVWMPTTTQASAFDPSTIDGWFDAALYIGAFDDSNDWTDGWTDHLD